MGSMTPILGGAEDPWNWLHNTTVGPGAVFEFGGEVSMSTFDETPGGAGQFVNGDRIRLQTNCSNNVIIYDIVIMQH
jgi:hypothetical protein